MIPVRVNQGSPHLPKERRIEGALIGITEDIQDLNEWLAEMGHNKRVSIDFVSKDDYEA